MGEYYRFWKKNPALLFSLYFILGIALKAFFSISLLYLLLFLIISSQLYLSRVMLGLSLTLIAFFITPGDYSFSEKESTALFYPSRVQAKKKHFRSGYIYEGTLELEGKKIRASTYFSKGRPKGPKVFLRGELIKNGAYNYFFKTKDFRDKPGFSLANFRYEVQQKLSSFLQKRIPSKDSFSLFNALFLGQKMDERLIYSFQKTGLSHLLAISGFHFTLISGILFFALRLFCKERILLFVMLIITTLYFLLLGSSPSILRAYLLAVCFILSELWGKERSIYHLLGITALVELLLYPPILFNISFQLTFISCFSLLFYQAPIEKLLLFVLPKRSNDEVEMLSFFSKAGYYLAVFFRKMLSISLAVNILLLPLMLFHFHQFPLISLLFNLFIPLLISCSMALFFLALAFPYLLDKLTLCTDFLLKLIYYPLPSLQHTLYVKSLPGSFLLIYLVTFFFLGVYLTVKKHLIALEPLNPAKVAL